MSMSRIASSQHIFGGSQELHLSPPGKFLAPENSLLGLQTTPYYSRDAGHLSVNLGNNKTVGFWEQKTLTDLGSNPDELDRATSLGSPPAGGEDKLGGRFIWGVTTKEDSKSGLQLTNQGSSQIQAVNESDSKNSGTDLAGTIKDSTKGVEKEFMPGRTNTVSQMLQHRLETVKEEKGQEQSPNSSPEKISSFRAVPLDPSPGKSSKLKRLSGIVRSYLERNTSIKLKESLSQNPGPHVRSKVTPMLMITTPDNMEVPNSSIVKYKGDSMTDLITAHAQKPRTPSRRPLPMPNSIQEIEDKEDSDSKGPAVLSRRISSESSESRKLNLSARLLSLEKKSQRAKTYKDKTTPIKSQASLDEEFQPKGLYKSVLAFKKLFEMTKNKNVSEPEEMQPSSLNAMSRTQERQLRQSRSATAMTNQNTLVASTVSPLKNRQPKSQSISKTLNPSAKPDGARNLRSGVLAMTFYKRLNRFAKRSYIKKTVIAPESGLASKTTTLLQSKLGVTPDVDKLNRSPLKSQEFKLTSMNRSESNDSVSNPRKSDSKDVHDTKMRHSNYSSEVILKRAEFLASKKKKADLLKAKLTSQVSADQTMIEEYQEPIMRPEIMATPQFGTEAYKQNQALQKRLSQVSHASNFTFLRSQPAALQLPIGVDSPAFVNRRKASNLWDFSFADNHVPQSPGLGSNSKFLSRPSVNLSFSQKISSKRNISQNKSSPKNSKPENRPSLCGYSYLFDSKQPPLPEDDSQLLLKADSDSVSPAPQIAPFTSATTNPNQPSSTQPQNHILYLPSQNHPDPKPHPLQPDGRPSPNLQLSSPQDDSQPKPSQNQQNQPPDLHAVHLPEPFLDDSLHNIDRDFDGFIKSQRELDDRPSEHSSLTMDIIPSVEPSARGSPNSRISPQPFKEMSSVGGIFGLGKDQPEQVSPTSPRKLESEIGSISKSLAIFKRKVGTDSMREISSKLEPTDKNLIDRSAVVSIVPHYHKARFRRASGTFERHHSVESIAENRVRIRKVDSQDVFKFDSKSKSGSRNVSQELSAEKLEKKNSAERDQEFKRAETYSKPSGAGSPVGIIHLQRKASDSSVIVSRLKTSEKVSSMSKMANNEVPVPRDSFSIKPIAGQDIFSKRVKKGQQQQKNKFKFPGDQSYSLIRLGNNENSRSQSKLKNITNNTSIIQQGQQTIQDIVAKEDDDVSNKSDLSDKNSQEQLDEKILEKRRRLKYLEEIGKAAGRVNQADEVPLSSTELQSKLMEFGTAIPGLFKNAGIGFGKALARTKNFKMHSKQVIRKKATKAVPSFVPLANVRVEKNPSASEFPQNSLIGDKAYIAVGHKSDMNIHFQPRNSLQHDRDAHNNSNISAFKAIPDDNHSPSKVAKYGSDNILT